MKLFVGVVDVRLCLVDGGGDGYDIVGEGSICSGRAAEGG